MVKEFCLSNIWKVGQEIFCDMALWVLIRKYDHKDDTLKPVYTLEGEQAPEDYSFFAAHKIQDY